MTLPAWVDGALFQHERARLFPSETYPTLVVGADEVGKGAWAGPITVCAFLAGFQWSFEGINDSKKLGPKRCATKARELLSAGGFRYAIRHVSSYLIDRVGITRAQEMAFELALDGVFSQLEPDEPPPLLVLDGDLDLLAQRNRHRTFTAYSLRRADGRVPHVMAASIIAKAQRDAVMVELDKLLPGYEFSRSKGYGTQKHEDLIRERGLSETHRRTFVPERALPGERP